MTISLPTRQLLVAAPVGLAAVVTTGLLALPSGAASAAGDDQLVKRDEDTPAVTTTLDDDDDDAGTGTNTGTNGNTAGNTGTNTGGTNTGTGTDTGDQNDPTSSRVTGVTRDDDVSRADLTTDLTDDGPGTGNVDDSRHHTNDASRNDTRG